MMQGGFVETAIFYYIRLFHSRRVFSPPDSSLTNGPPTLRLFASFIDSSQYSTRLFNLEFLRRYPNSAVYIYP